MARHRVLEALEGYQAWRLQAVELSITPPQTPSGDEPDSPSSSAWPGLRPFRVERKVIEDINQTVCSFYLAPLDGRPLPAFSLQVPVPGGGTEQLVCCYSLSDAPARDHYRYR